VSGTVVTPAGDQEQADTAALLRSFGIPDERHDDYLNEIRGMIALAFDAYFASLKDNNGK
jgi:hypothetical protein